MANFCISCGQNPCKCNPCRRCSCGKNPCCCNPCCCGSSGGAVPAVPMSVIPFCISKYGTELSTDAFGEPLLIAFSGFGPTYYIAEHLMEGEWATGTITIREDMRFASSFVMPYNSIIRNINVLISNSTLSNFEEGAIIHPFVCLAVSNSDELVYTILQNTITFTEPFLGGEEYPIHTLRRGVMPDMNIAIPEGTLVAIVAGIMGENVTSEQLSLFNVSGGLLLE